MITDYRLMRETCWPSVCTAEVRVMALEVWVQQMGHSAGSTALAGTDCNKDKATKVWRHQNYRGWITNIVVKVCVAYQLTLTISLIAVSPLVGGNITLAKLDFLLNHRNNKNNSKLKAGRRLSFKLNGKDLFERRVPIRRTRCCPLLHYPSLMKQFYSEEMLEMICNYGRYTGEYIPISGSRWRFGLHRTAQYEVVEGRWVGGRISHNGSKTWQCGLQGPSTGWLLHHSYWWHWW